MLSDDERSVRITAVQWTLLALILGLPASFWYGWSSLPAWGTPLAAPSSGKTYSPSPLLFRQSEPLPQDGLPPWTTHVQAVDWNGDGRLDVLVCDARWNRVLLSARQTDGSWKLEELASNVVAPAHATVVDLDQDGRRELLISELGSIWPDDTRVGRLTWLRPEGDRLEPQVILDDVRRIADAQPGDFDGDGDVDLAVAVFGYARGSVLWLENDGAQQFTPHTLLLASGAIHVPVSDFDGDGDLDIATVISQDREQVFVFENLGNQAFAPHIVFESLNYDLGSAGLVRTDLDRDGDTDLLLPVGDNLEDEHAYPQPYHGCYWLENRGKWSFVAHRIADLGGTYAAAAGDVDGDQDLDVVLVSMSNDWETPDHASAVWLENDGRQHFTTWQFASQPTHLVTVDCADLNNDGCDDILAGPLMLLPPFLPASPVVIWSPDRTEAR